MIIIIANRKSGIKKIIVIVNQKYNVVVIIKHLKMNQILILNNP